MPNSKKIKKTSMTLDKLALMMGKGFNEVHEKIDTLKKDTNILKEDVSVLKEDVSILKEDVSVLKEKVDEVIDTQDKLLKDVGDLRDENVMDMAFRGRVEGKIARLEQEVKVIKEKVKIKN